MSGNNHIRYERRIDGRCELVRAIPQPQMVILDTAPGAGSHGLPEAHVIDRPAGRPVVTTRKPAMVYPPLRDVIKGAAMFAGAIVAGLGICGTFIALNWLLERVIL